MAELIGECCVCVCVSHLWGEKFRKSQGGNKKILGGFRFYWLEYYFPIGEAFSGAFAVSFREGNVYQLFPQKNMPELAFRKCNTLGCPPSQ